MRSRIAVFEGYGAPFRGLGGPIFDNPRSPSLGRRGYYVPPQKYVSSDSRGGYGPARKPRAGYKVKKMKDTPEMKRAQKRFAKAAKKCSRRGARSSSFQVCMRRELKRKRSKR